MFDADGRLTGIRDRHGNLSTLTYDASGRLSAVSDWLTPTVRTVTFAYDTNSPSRLRTVTDREGNTTIYGYDGTSQRLTTITDDNGHVALTLSYDAQGRVATQKDARGLATGQQWTFSYVTNGDGTKTTTVTAPATSHEPSWNPTTADTYDTQGRLVKRVTKPTSSSAEDVTTEYSYDADGNLATAKDGRGFTTTFCYDVGEHSARIVGSWRNLTRRIAPAPTSGGAVLVTLFAYDVHDNLTRTIPPKGVSSTSTTGCTTDLSSSLDLDYATTMTYDAAGVKLLSTTRQSTDPDTSATGVAKTTFEYDSSQPGLVSYITPPRGNTGSSSDHADATHFTYYGASDPSSKRGLLKSVNDPPGNTTTFDHDAERATDYIDDGLGRVRTETQYPSWPSTASPLVMTTTYDPNGNRATVTDQLGRTTTYAYDRINRLTGIDFSDAGTPDVTFTYDANGNRAMMVDGTGTTSYSYDELNRLLAVTSPASPSSTRRSATATTATATG